MAFEGAAARRVLQYMNETFGTEPEFLWAKYPNNAVLRRKDNRKWYAALLSIPKNKLGLSGEDTVDILDLKCSPSMIGSLMDGRCFLPAYHMNKEHWITVLLDGSVPEEELFPLIDLSFQLAKK